MHLRILRNVESGFMKLVFFSADRLEVQRVGEELAGAGIPCEVRDEPISAGAVGKPFEAELWVLHDKDSSRAFMSCVESGVGFARRRSKAPDLDLWGETVVA
jgi:hypothetical protein